MPTMLKFCPIFRGIYSTFQLCVDFFHVYSIYIIMITLLITFHNSVKGVEKLEVLNELRYQFSIHVFLRRSHQWWKSVVSLLTRLRT